MTFSRYKGKRHIDSVSLRRNGVKGDVKITVLEDGTPKKSIHGHNLVVVGGRELVAAAIAGMNYQVAQNDKQFYYISKMGVGDGGALAATDGNLTLQNPIYSNLVPATDIEIPEDALDTVVFTHTISLKNFSGGLDRKTVNEAGLFYEKNGTLKLFSRYTFPEINLYYTPESDISIEIQWTISVPAKLD